MDIAIRHSAILDKTFYHFVNNESKKIMKDLVRSNRCRVLGILINGILLKGSEPPLNIPKDLRIYQEFYAERYAFHSINLYCCWTVKGQFHIKGLPNYNSSRPAFVTEIIKKLTDVAIGASPSKLQDICEWAINSKKWSLTDLTKLNSKKL